MKIITFLKLPKTAKQFSIQDKKALTLSSIMMCPAEGGMITPKETAWEA